VRRRGVAIEAGRTDGRTRPRDTGRQDCHRSRGRSGTRDGRRLQSTRHRLHLAERPGFALVIKDRREPEPESVIESAIELGLARDYPTAEESLDRLAARGESKLLSQRLPREEIAGSS